MPAGLRLKNRYLFDRLPVVHALVFAVQLLGIAHVSWSFSDNFGAKPMLTTMVMNSLLNGIADTIAQSVTAVRHRTLRKKVSAKKDGIAIELGEKSIPGLPAGNLYASLGFNVDRLLRYMGWGFMMAPPQLLWLQWLSEFVPATEDNRNSAVLWRVAFDQLLFSPIALVLFFVFMTAAEGGGKKALRKKLDAVFMSTLKSNFVVWPAVQVINFRFLPLELQLPFGSTIGVCWNTYLSLKNDAADPDQR